MGPKLMDAILTTLKRLKDKTDARIDALEGRLTALEERGVPQYRGVYDGALWYAKGDVVTHAGSMWIAGDWVQGVRPGEADEASRAWTLCVKRGRDGVGR